MKIKFYTKDRCPKCNFAMRTLLSNGLVESDIEIIDATPGKDENTSANFDFLKSEGHKSFPVVYTEDFEPIVDNKLNELREIAKFYSNSAPKSVAI